MFTYVIFLSPHISDIIHLSFSVLLDLVWSSLGPHLNKKRKEEKSPCHKGIGGNTEWNKKAKDLDFSRKMITKILLPAIKVVKTSDSLWGHYHLGYSSCFSDLGSLSSRVIFPGKSTLTVYFEHLAVTYNSFVQREDRTSCLIVPPGLYPTGEE